MSLIKMFFLPYFSHLQNQEISVFNKMEKRADGADASVLFFLLSCANFLAVYAQTRLNTVLIAEC